MHLSDKEIVDKIKTGDFDAFSDFVELYKDKAFSLTLKILKNEEEAEDSLQEAFLKLYKAIKDEKFKGDAKLSTYFYTIVYNTAIDQYKKTKQKSFSVISIDVNDHNFRDGDELNVKEIDSDVDSERIATDNEIQSIINKFLNEIPVQYSLILILFYVDDLSHEEISSLLGIPVGTVKNRIFRAKEKVKEIILKRIPEHEILNYI